MHRDNVAEVIVKFVNHLEIQITRQGVKDELQIHPDHNSMLAISDVLNNWNVPNTAYPLTFNELLAANISDVFIAFVSGDEFAVISHIDENYVIISNEKWNNYHLTTDEFKKIYSGAILLAKKMPESGERDYKAKHNKEIIESLRLPVVIGAAIVFLLTYLLLNSNYVANLNLQVALLTLFKTTGLFTTILLLIQIVDNDNPFIQKLCGDDRDKNCNAVLTSKAAKINSYLSWSEVGFFYFAGTWLVVLLYNNHIAVLKLIALLNILSLPYTFYSIYHQWKVAKQWCLLCCIVQALLWMEFFAYLPLLNKSSQLPNFVELSNVGICMLSPVLFWMFIKPYLLIAKQIRPLKGQLRSYKYNSALFEKIVYEGVKYGLPPDEHSLIIGNRDAENIITMVSNPYCKPCAKAHKGLAWLHERKDVKLQVIFAIPGYENDPKTKVANHWLSLQNKNDDQSLKKALDDWYDQKQKNYDAWAKEYPLIGKENFEQVLKVNQDWCEMTDISETPTLFINGRKLPEFYQTEDLKYYI